MTAAVLIATARRLKQLNLPRLLSQAINVARPLSTVLSIFLVSAVSGAKGQSSNAIGSGSVPELVTAFRVAHDNRDLDGMMNLFCWDEVTAETRQVTEKEIEESFDSDISTLRTTTEHPRGRLNEFVRDGIPYGFNLTVIEELVMETALPKSGPQTVYYPIGVKNGRYFFAQMARETSTSPQMVRRPSPVRPAANTQETEPRPSHTEAHKITIPAMTSMTVRLDQAVGMDLIAEGGKFSATFSDAVQVNGVTAIPAGSIARGVVTKQAAYSPEIKLEGITVNGQEIRLKTFPITFNERISFPANSEMSFHLMFSTAVMTP